LVQASNAAPSSATTSGSAASSTSTAPAQCPADPTTLFLSDPPYSNYFLKDCHGETHVVVTSPLTTSNLALIGPRLIVAWPSGNSGVAAYFKPASGENGTLALRLLEQGSSSTSLPVNRKPTTALKTVYRPQSEGSPIYGVSGVISFNTSAILTLSILGSIRTIRDFVEGPSLLRPVIQDAIKFSSGSSASNSSVVLQRLWLDNVTTTTLSFVRTENSQDIYEQDDLVYFTKGDYYFNATLDYPSLEPLSPQQVLNEQSQSLLTGNITGEWTTSLSFLSTTQKLLAVSVPSLILVLRIDMYHRELGDS